MEEWEKKYYDKVKRLIEDGVIIEGAKVEYRDGDAFIRSDYVKLPIGIINSCGCDVDWVYWL
jgi:hypothetical protein